MLYTPVTTCNRFVSRFTEIIINYQNEQMHVEQADEFIFHIKDGMKTFTVKMDQGHTHA